MMIFDFCPQAPEWRLDWTAIDRAFPWIQALRGVPQNPKFHAEGDVWVHTRMVCEALIAQDAWRELPEVTRHDLFAAALLHDSAKPECTKIQKNGRISSRGHARRGALLARRVLWRQGVPPARRERICRLVRHHMVPLYLRDSDHQERQVLTLSHQVRCRHLSMLGRADASGRICDDADDLAARHLLFAATCRAAGVLDRGFVFSSEHAKFRYFRYRSDDPLEVVDEPDHEIVLMSGLPGGSQRRWLESHAADRPLIDVEALRRHAGVGWSDNQGAVIAAARDRAREYVLAGRPFIWWDLNLSRQLRDQLIQLFATFETRVCLLHFESDASRVEAELETRGLDHDALEFLASRWEAPDATEAHAVHSIDAVGEMTVMGPASTDFDLHLGDVGEKQLALGALV